jgi:hypothetical protein
MTGARPFLTASWRHLAMLNYEVDPAVLENRIPCGTELDDWQGRVLVSMVGFLFLDVKVLGLPIPFHRNFEEVNLRFYVRRKTPDGWRRGVVFVKEIVPRPAIAWVARTVYQEPYEAMPMQHRVDGADATPGRVEYRWTSAKSPHVLWRSCGGGVDNRLWVESDGVFRDLREGGEAEFITEHYWGYTRRRNGDTWEYQVEHPRWRVADVRRAGFECDVAALYGPEFTGFLTGTPSSSLLAEGSPVTVRQGVRIHP